jgi:hypothetical protein
MHSTEKTLILISLADKKENKADKKITMPK